jgi:hypothetical protein
MGQHPVYNFFSALLSGIHHLVTRILDDLDERHDPVDAESREGGREGIYADAAAEADEEAVDDCGEEDRSDPDPIGVFVARHLAMVVATFVIRMFGRY